MNKLFTKIATLSVGLAMAVGVGVALASSNVKAMPAKAADTTMTFDFEADSAHRTSGNNSYTGTNVYSQNDVTITLNYADSVTTGGPITGSANVQGRVAKNTTNSPSAKLGNFAFPAGTVVKGITYKTSGVSTMSMVVAYSTDDSTYTELQSIESMPTTATSKSISDLSISALNFYLKWTASVASSVNSNRDFKLDDIVITYELPSNPILSVSPNSLSFLTEGASQEVTVTATNFSATPTISVEGTPEFVDVDIDGLTLTVSPVAIGTETLTIKGVNGGENATAQLSINVKDKHGYVADDPFNVVEAKALIDTDKSATFNNVFVGGIISKIDSYDSSSKSITYWISDDGTTTNQFEVYKGKGLAGADFASKDDIELGATVVVSGSIMYYSASSVYEFGGGSQQVSYTAPVKVLSSISLSGTYKTEFEVGDTFDHEGLIVTAHYADSSTKDVSSSAEFSGFDSSEVVASQEITVSYTENEVTKTAKYNVSIVAPIVKHTITFNAGGGSGTMDPVQVNDGADYTLPECGFTAPEGQKFENWSVGGTRRDPGYVIEGVNEDIELIALWADIEMAIYEKVTTELEDYSGTYLIVYEGDADHGKFAFNGSLAKLDATDNGTSITIANYNTEAAEDNEFTIAKSGDVYSIRAANGKYIGQNSDTNGLTESETALDNSISFDGGIVIRSSGGAYLRYNYASNQNRFRYFKSASYEGQQAIALYKKVTYTAAAFAQKLLDDTKDLCDAYGPTSDYDSYKAQLTTIWSTLSGSSYYGQLGVTGKALLKDIEGDEGGELIAQALARYDYLTSKYELDNFITGRIVSGLANVTTPITVSESNSTTAMIVVTIVALTSVSAIAVLLVIKRRKSI